MSEHGTPPCSRCVRGFGHAAARTASSFAVSTKSRSGAERCTRLGKYVVSERGEEAVERVRKLTGGHGAHSVLECVGARDAALTAIEIARPGGAVGRVGVPHYEAIPGAGQTFYKNVTVGGGPAPVRAYIDELLPDILEGRIDPGRVFDRAVGLDGVPDGYRAMNERESIKVMVTPA